MNRFDWPGLLQIGCRGLGLKPHEFWRLTPAEFLVMLGKAGRAAPLNRERLQDLAHRFPDEHGAHDG